MDINEILKTLFLFCAGLGIFIFGLKFLGDSLESAAGKSLRRLFGKVSNNKFVGIGIGIVVTVAIQSSSATTVMVVGFVNAGIMSLVQATTIIMGANIGTTVTAQIVALQGLAITEFFAALACVGAFIVMFAKKQKLVSAGNLMLSVGMIFAGLEFMGASMKAFAAVEENGVPILQSFFASVESPLIFLIVAMLITAVVQSSAVTISVLISMAASGIIGIDNAIMAVIGSNIGTCITAIIAAIGTNTNAKRAAGLHLMIKIIGAIVFGVLFTFLPFGEWLEAAFPGSVPTQIAMFHTISNVVITFLMIPFVKHMVRLIELIIKDNGKKSQKELHFEYIDDRFLASPSIAVEQVKKEIATMAEDAKANLELSIDAICNIDLSRKEEFAAREKKINFLNREITHYLVKLAALDLSYSDEIIVSSFYHVVSDIERIGDYAENIVEYTEQADEEQMVFSAEAIEEIRTLNALLVAQFDQTILSFKTASTKVSDEIESREDQIDEYTKMLTKKHIDRLNEGKCSSGAGSVFLSLTSNLERIGDHIRNVFMSLHDYC